MIVEEMIKYDKALQICKALDDLVIDRDSRSRTHYHLSGLTYDELEDIRQQMMVELITRERMIRAEIEFNRENAA